MIHANIYWRPASGVWYASRVYWYKLGELLNRSAKGSFYLYSDPKRRLAWRCWSGNTSAATINAWLPISPVGEETIGIVFLNYYQDTLNQFCQQGIISRMPDGKTLCRSVRSSEDMRAAMDKGASGVIALLAQKALENGRRENAGLRR